MNRTITETELRWLVRRELKALMKEEAEGIDDYDEGKEEELDEKAPPGFEKVVKGLKKNPKVDNPFALAWSMKDKGDKPRGKR